VQPIVGKVRRMPVTLKNPGIRTPRRIAVTPQAAGAARQPPGASSGHHVPMALVGLAAAARLVRDPRSYETAIMVVIAVAAAGGLGQASRASLWARLAAWDRRRNASELPRMPKGPESLAAE